MGSHFPQLYHGKEVASIPNILKNLVKLSCWHVIHFNLTY